MSSDLVAELLTTVRTGKTSLVRENALDLLYKLAADGVRGARGEAESGFPHIIEIGLPMLRNSRSQGLTEEFARINALVAIMADLDDTCLLHRGGLTALALAKADAKIILQLGGTSTADGFRALYDLDHKLLRLNASPGGSADLLAGVLFLDFIERSFDLKRVQIGNVAF